MANKPTVSGKTVGFSDQHHNFLLDIEKNEMYSLDTYLTGRLRQHSHKLSQMRFLEMIRMDLPALQLQGIEKSDCEALIISFTYLRTITSFLDDILREIHNNKNVKVQKFIDELHDIFAVPSSVFIGYNQYQLIQVLRFIHSSLKGDESLSASRNKFIEICQTCAENASFLPDYQHQLSSWIRTTKGEYRHSPSSSTKMAMPGKSSLRKSQE